MFISYSSVKIVDNTGVKSVYLILDSKKTAKVGDTATCVIERVRQNAKKFMKGQISRIQILNSRFGYKYFDGTVMRSIDSNSGIIVNKQGDPVGTRITIPFPRQSFRRKGFTKILSISPFTILFFNGS